MSAQARHVPNGTEWVEEDEGATIGELFDAYMIYAHGRLLVLPAPVSDKVGRLLARRTALRLTLQPLTELDPPRIREAVTKILGDTVVLRALSNAALEVH